MRCVKISTSDDRMDCRNMFYDPINPLPRKCLKCGFPDLDHVPQPYFLVKSRTMGPNELAGAENGNFFIRERVRRVFDLLVPELCATFRLAIRELPSGHRSSLQSRSIRLPRQRSTRQSRAASRAVSHVPHTLDLSGQNPFCALIRDQTVGAANWTMTS